MRTRLTYANVAATMALVFSMSGGALAASHYLINSTKQINPKVLKKLKGNTGPKGATGATGATGASGSPGAPGAAGATGPSHVYSALGTGTASVSVPAGSYAISGDGLFVNSGAKPGGGECTLEGPGVSESRWSTVPNVGEEEGREKVIYGTATVANSSVVVLKAPGMITEKCRNSLEGQLAVSASSTRVTAILVGAVN